jgi:hypothetical protein
MREESTGTRKLSWRRIAAKPKGLLFQLAAVATGVLLMVFVVPIFLRVVVPTRQNEVNASVVEYTGLINDTYNVQAWLPDQDKELTFTEKSQVCAHNIHF